MEMNNKRLSGFFKGFVHPVFLARVVSWLALKWRQQRQTWRRHVEGLLNETAALKKEIFRIPQHNLCIGAAVSSLPVLIWLTTYWIKRKNLRLVTEV